MDLGLRSELAHLGIFRLWKIIRSTKSRKMRGSSQIHAQSLYSQGKKRTWNLQGRQRWKEKLEQMEEHTGQGKMGAWAGMVPTFRSEEKPMRMRTKKGGVKLIISRRWWVFPGGAKGKEPACPCKRHKKFEFDRWVGRIPWKRVWQPTPVFFPGESHGQRVLVG